MLDESAKQPTRKDPYAKTTIGQRRDRLTQTGHGPNATRASNNRCSGSKNRTSMLRGSTAKQGKSNAASTNPCRQLGRRRATNPAQNHRL